MGAPAQKPKLSKREKRIRRRLRDDFPHYAKKCLRIKTKSGGLAPLVLNEAQLYLHGRIEDQKRRRGWVRIIVLKGRQQGCSTMVGGRYYHQTTHRKGCKAYILTHEDKATQNLFEMTGRYHDNCPALVKPVTGAANANELSFERLDSGYALGTAKSKGTGRSLTVQLFHGSEVAFWANADSHMAGVLQAIAREPGTEIVLESTSNGPEGVFYEMALAAQRGEGDYELVFIPWFWSKEYRAEPPEDFTLTGEEEAYKADHGLDDAQMYWRRLKTQELGGAHHWRREYPATVEEAFKAAAVGALMTQELLDSTRVDAMPTDAEGEPLDFVRIVVGIDPSGGGGPKSAEAGLVCGGLATNGHAYVWRDDSGRLSPDAWATKSLTAVEEESADAIVAEKNFGGDMVEVNIRSKAKESRNHRIRNVRVILVTSSRGKQLRAEPVVALFEQGRAHHVGRLIALEDEWTTWVPNVSKWSPGRIDAEVFVLTELLLGEGGAVHVEYS